MKVFKQYMEKYDVKIMLKILLYYKKEVGVILLFLFFHIGFSYLPPLINAIIIDFGIYNKNVVILLSSVSGLYLISFFIEWVSIIKTKKESKIRFLIKKDLNNKILDFCMRSGKLQKTKGEIDTLLKQDCAVYTMLISNILEDVFGNIFGIAFIVFMLFSLQKKLATIIIMFQLGLIVFQLWGNQMMEKKSMLTRVKYVEFMDIVSEVIENMGIIVPVGAKRYEKARYNSSMINEFDEELKQTMFEMKITSGMSLFTTLVTCVILSIGGKYVIEGQMTLGRLLSFSQYSSIFLTPIIQLLSLPMQFSNNYSSIKSVSQILKFKRGSEEKNKSDVYNGNSISKIELKELSFRYNETYVLRTVNLVFEQGIINYVVGKSGIGKSTLADLITGRLKPNEGDILFGNMSIVGMDIEKISTYVTYVSQDSVIFKDTILNNIILDGEVDMNRVRQICIDCQIWKDIEDMEQGIYTKISGQGRNLSGGQKNRICLARALYMDRPIVVLDEVTAALDNQMESDLRRALMRYCKEKIFVVITHSKNFIAHRSNVYHVYENRIEQIVDKGDGGKDV